MSSNPIAEVLKDWGNKLVETDSPEKLVRRIMILLGFGDVVRRLQEYLPEAARAALEEAYEMIRETLEKNTYLAELANTDVAKIDRAAGRIIAAGAIAALRVTVASSQRALMGEL